MADIQVIHIDWAYSPRNDWVGRESRQTCNLLDRAQVRPPSDWDGSHCLVPCRQSTLNSLRVGTHRDALREIS